jgi:hypothetical protein
MESDKVELKNSTLSLLRAIVTFTVSSLNTSSSGAGRKSGTTFKGPNGSSVYLIFALINLLTLAPIACTVNPDKTTAVCKSDSQDAASNLSETVIPFFTMAVTGLQL